MVQDRHYAFARDILRRALTVYTGVTTIDGAITNDTLVDANLIGVNDFLSNKTILILSGNAEGEDWGITSFNPANGTITTTAGFSAQILAGTLYIVLNISTVEVDVDRINTKLGTNVDLPGTTTVFAYLAMLAASGVSIFDLVNAMLVLTETGGVVIATGLLTEDDVYINNAPAGVFKPILVTIDMSDLAGGEVATIRTYYRIRALGALELKGAPVIFNGVQAEPLKDITLQPNRFGVQVTIEATAAVEFDWEVFYGV